MDCGRPRQVSELWAALVRTTGLSNLPPWRACERTGQGLDSWELGAAATRASVGREPVTAEDCGSDCGSGVASWARTPTGF